MIALTSTRALPRGLSGLADRLFRYREQRAARRLMEELAAHDDALLHDIGLRRLDLAIAWQMLDGVGQGGGGLSGEAALRYLSRMAEERRAAGP